VTDASLPTTPVERRAATAAWRAVPYPVRRRVVSTARRGEVAPDLAAFAARRQWAETMLRPRGEHWWQRQPGRLWLRLALVVTLAAETAWSVGVDGVSWPSVWPLPAGACLLLLVTLLDLGLRRSLRRLVAVPATAEISATPPSSAPPEQGASSSR
jgi:hypothetical protein